MLYVSRRLVLPSLLAKNTMMMKPKPERDERSSIITDFRRSVTNCQPRERPRVPDPQRAIRTRQLSLRTVFIVAIFLLLTPTTMPRVD
jgi:hypothetical protein